MRPPWTFAQAASWFVVACGELARVHPLLLLWESPDLLRCQIRQLALFPAEPSLQPSCSETSPHGAQAAIGLPILLPLPPKY